MNMLETALTYHARGWAPIPLHGKRPLLGSWRRFQNERPTEEQIRAWWSDENNIGLICGAISKMVVVDIDGDVALGYVALMERGIPFEECPAVKTGKGLHLYYAHPGTPVANGVGVIKDEGGRFAIDLRGDGGYVVAPPSKHPDSGTRYEWRHTPEQSIVQKLPALPDFFKAAHSAPVLPTSKVEGATSDVTGLLQPVGEGGRNAAAARLAGYLMKVTGEDTGAALGMLRLWNAQNAPPLPERELTRTFDSIVARRQRDPETRKREEAESLTVALSGKAWADSVRDQPPRVGTETSALPTIDRMGGLVPRDLVILAGRPGMGKSTCAWNIVADVCIGKGVPTVVFSTEMTANDVARWMASKLHDTPVADITPEQWRNTLARISAAPVTMIDRGSLSISEIEEAVHERPETRLVIVDHIQRIRTAGRESRNYEIGEVAQRLKSLAKDTPCTVLLLSQMNRASDADGRPPLRALRDSGELEQEADGVIFLWSRADDPTANPLEVEFYMAKNRHGAMTEATYSFHKDLKKFIPISGEEILREREREARHKEQLYLLEHGTR